MKKKNGLSFEDINRYIDMVREFGITEALIRQKEITKSKKKFEKRMKEI